MMSCCRTGAVDTNEIGKTGRGRRSCGAGKFHPVHDTLPNWDGALHRYRLAPRSDGVIRKEWDADKQVSHI